MASKKPPVAKGKAMPTKGKAVPPKGKGGVSLPDSYGATDAQASAREKFKKMIAKKKAAAAKKK